MRVPRNHEPPAQKASVGAQIVSRAELGSQCSDELFGHRIGMIMDERGISLDTLVENVSSIPSNIRRDYLSQLRLGQVLFPIRPEWKRDVIHALGIIENRGQLELMSGDELDAFVQQKTPRQTKMTL
jgi:hypothetical protein